jgi:hypothetical protein
VKGVAGITPRFQRQRGPLLLQELHDGFLRPCGNFTTVLSLKRCSSLVDAK